MSSPARAPSSPSSAHAPSSPTRERDEVEAEPEEEGEGEELLDEKTYLQDYRPIEALDRYEDRDLSEGEYDEASADQKQAAEREIRKREREAEAKRRAERPTGGVPAALMPSDDEADMPARRRRRIGTTGAQDDGTSAAPDTGAPGVGAGDADTEDAGQEEAPINLDDFKGSLRDFFALEPTQREVRRRFKAFLSDFQEEDQQYAKYPRLIGQMCASQQQSLEVSYLDLSHSVPVLAIWLADEPRLMLDLLDQELMEVVKVTYPEFPKIVPEVHVRITRLPIVDKLRDLRHVHLNSLVRVEGVVTRRTTVFPQLKLVKFNCVKCNESLGPITQTSATQLDKPGRCSSCQSNGPFNIDTQETVYRNFQKITLQESPGSVPAGRVPRQKEVILLHDLVDSVTPGEEVEITGIYEHTYDAALNTRNGFPVFNTIIRANHISRRLDLSSKQLTDDDIKTIHDLAKDPNVGAKIVESIAPSIWGHHDVKTALALAMFGGEPKQMDKHRIRGDINVLLLGDPGTAKSQFLKYVEHTSRRAVYTTGKGASAVGLTASVRLDPLTREWTLEGGALVLADQGMCLIDEFDKMNDQDRTSIHEAMEQQSISISKAGIVCQLKARCSVVAAANPVNGRYDPSASLADNVELTDAILSRFDIMRPVKDVVDPDTDRRLATFVVQSHVDAHPTAKAEAVAAGGAETRSNGASAHPAGDDRMVDDDVKSSQSAGGAHSVVDQAVLRKYITYARDNCHPKLHNVDDDKIAKLYAELRRESAAGGLPIAVRHIESMIRMSEAHAKMHLRDHVTEDDVNMAIRVMLDSFISSQKYSVGNTLKKHFSKYLSYKKDSFELIMYLLRSLLNERRQLLSFKGRGDPLDEQSIEIPVDELQAKAEEVQISNLDPFFKSALFRSNGFSIVRQGRFIRKAPDAEL